MIVWSELSAADWFHASLMGGFSVETLFPGGRVVCALRWHCLKVAGSGPGRVPLDVRSGAVAAG